MFLALEVVGQWMHYNSMTMCKRLDRVLRAGAGLRQVQSYAIER